MIKLKRYFFHKQAINFVNYYVFTIISAAISIVSISYLTTRIQPEDYGKIGIFSGILFFMPSLVVLCANGLQAIEIVDLDETDYLNFRNQYITFALLNASLFIILAGIVSAFIPAFSFVIMMATLMGLVQSLSSIHSTELFQYSKATQFGLISIATVLLGFLFTFIFISFFNLGWKFRIISLLGSEFIMLVARFGFLSSIGRKFKFTLSKEKFKVFVYYGSPLILSAFAGWVINQSDRFFLLHFFTLKEVGIYAAAAGLSTFVTMINGNMLKVIYPLVFQKLKDKIGKAFIYKLTFLYSILILLFAFIFCLGIHFFGHYFLGKKYLEAYPIIYLMCFGQAFFGIYGTTGIVIDYFKKTKLKTGLIILGAIIIIVLSFTLTPIIGITGPAVSALLAFVFLAVRSFFIARKLFVKYEIN